jgi:O-antigen/teichoic acid export membrane protein
VSSSVVQTIFLAIRSIVLARLLSPNDYGVYVFISSIILLTSAIPNFGMSAAFVHRVKESEGEEALRVYFTLTFIFNVSWAIVMAGLAPFIVEKQFLLVFLVILATQVIDNLARVGQVRLVKKVVFRRIALIDILVVIGTSISAVFLAWKGFQIWSLVATDIIAALIVVVGYYLIRPIWRPKFGWSSQSVKYFLDFGKRTFLAGFLGQALDRVDDLWTGFFLGDAALGFYSRAYTFATYPRKILAMPLNTVAGSTYAELKDHPKKLSQAFFRVNAFLIRSGFFLAGLLALVAPEFIHLVIGEKWLPMLPAFRLMLIYTLLDPIKGTIANLFISVGHPEKVVRIRVVQLMILILALFLLGPRWGISGVALAVNIMLVAGIVILLFQARAIVQFSIRKLFVVPIFSILVSLAITFLFIVISGVGGNLIMSGLAKLFTFGLSYAFLIFILERKQITKIFKVLSRTWINRNYVT